MTPTTYPPEPLPYPPQRPRSIFHAIAIALVMASALPPLKARGREPARLPAGLAEFIDQTMVL